MQAYMNCIKYNGNDNGKCRHLSRDYLQCRMDKGLMDHDEMDNLGFKDVDSSPPVQPHSGKSTNAAQHRLESQGRGAFTGSTPSYAGDTHGAEGNVNSAKAGSGSPADEKNRGYGAGEGNAKGHVSRQAGSFAGDSHGRGGAGRLV